MEVYNLTSLYEGFPLVRLVPPFEIIDNGGNNFDINYLMWLMNDPVASKDFFNIIFKVSVGVDVCILIVDDERFDMIHESIQKLISQRYGIVSNVINDMEDWDEVTEIGPRTPAHVYNLDYDMNMNWGKLDKSMNTL